MFELPPLTNGTIQRRYKRFLADVTLDSGEEVIAHCPNTGAMTGCWAPGAKVQLSASTNPKRKLAWTLERVDMGHGWIGVNTARTNQIFGAFLRAKAIPEFASYDYIKPEPAYNAEGFDKSRFDFLLQSAGLPDCYIEIKNTTLFTGQHIQFPDAVSTRGRKHLQLLAHAAALGHRSVMLYGVNHPQGEIFKPAVDVDPDYSMTLSKVARLGVEVLAIRIHHTEAGCEVGDRLGLLID